MMPTGSPSPPTACCSRAAPARGGCSSTTPRRGAPGGARREDAASVRSRVPRRNAARRRIERSVHPRVERERVGTRRRAPRSPHSVDEARSDRREPGRFARFPSRSRGWCLRRPLRARGGRCPWREARDVRRRVERRRSAREDATALPRRRRSSRSRSTRSPCSMFVRGWPSLSRGRTRRPIFRCRRCSPRTAHRSSGTRAIGWRHLGRENWEGARPNPPSTADGGPAVGDLAGQRGIRGVRLDA